MNVWKLLVDVCPFVRRVALGRKYERRNLPTRNNTHLDSSQPTRVLPFAKDMPQYCTLILM
jgi:hypothetical protein